MMSAIPGIITALYTAIGAANPGFTVIDGMRAKAQADKARIFIGASMGSGTIAEAHADGSQSPQDLPGIVNVERFGLTSIIEEITGDTNDIAAKRVLVFTALDTFKAAIKPDSVGITLGVKELAHAYLASWLALAPQTDRGLYFGIECRIEFVLKPSVT
jgi:hypothetical protein